MKAKPRSCSAAAAMAMAAVEESGPRNVSGSMMRRAVPSVTGPLITAGMMSSLADLHTGHCGSMNSRTVTGAPGFPMAKPSCGSPLVRATTASAPRISEAVG